ncbi:Secretory lipase domain containing protein [Hyaloscypha variabilis]
MRFLSGSLLFPCSLFVGQIFASVLPSFHYGLNSLVQRDGNASWLLPVPTQDPWYSAPSDWETKSPGTPLRVRYSPYRNISIGACIDTFQVLYRTTDTNNNASWAVTTVFIPESQLNCSASSPENCSHGVVTYEVPYDSADPDATPSYLLQYGEPYGEIYELLKRGWFVNTPDYEGPLASYCAGVQSGHATIDSIRAVLQVSEDFGLNHSVARNAIWGYSGGAMASEFSAELIGAYAPDLKLAGIVHGGLIPNVTSAGNKMTSKDTAGLAIAGIIGITSQQTDARKYIDSRLKTTGPFNKTLFYTATEYSGAQVLGAFENQNVSDYFYNGTSDLDVPIMNDIYYSDATMGHHGVPNMPVFVYKAIHDEMSAAAETDALVDSFCSQGANILYHRNDVGGHNEELWQGRGRALSFLSDVLEDTDLMSMPKTGCSILNVTVAVNVTLVNGTALEGTVVKPYAAITVNRINVTVLSNGSVLVPFNGTMRIAELRNSLDVLGAAEELTSKGWFVTG